MLGAASLGSLESLDVALAPRAALAQAIQKMLVGDAMQRDVREDFDQAEAEARKCRNGLYEAQRWSQDPEYRVNAYVLHMAAGYWARMFQISSDPQFDAQNFIRQMYTTDFRKDPLLEDMVSCLTHQKTRRDRLTPACDALFEDMIDRTVPGTSRSGELSTAFRGRRTSTPRRPPFELVPFQQEYVCGRRCSEEKSTTQVRCSPTLAGA